MLARDHYATLGVPPTADGDQIEQAHRHLCRRYHPDINPGDAHAAAVFERIDEAYQVLSDPERRARYDREGSLTDALESDAPDLTVQVLPENAGGSYADLFRRLRHHTERSAPVRGPDIHATVNVPLWLAERGRRATVVVQRQVACEQCGGRGRIQLDRTRPCNRCNGVGRETFVKGAISVTCPCAECDGHGLRAGIACSHCLGNGLTSQPETVLVRVPPGVQDGQTFTISGGGHAGPRGGDPGDLLVRCQVDRVEGFERHGPHLGVNQPISIAEAILGGKVEVIALDDTPTTLRLPPGTQSGRVFRLRGRGLELPDGRRGDMLVRVEIRIPESIDEDSKALIRQFARLNPRSWKSDAATRSSL